jgi:hypothetical protein
MHDQYEIGNERSIATTGLVCRQVAEPKDARQLWAIRLESLETGHCLDVDGIVLTWYTRYLDDTIRELMADRDPNLWRPKLERMPASHEDFLVTSQARPKFTRRARRLRLGAGIVRDEAPNGVRTNMRQETRDLWPAASRKVSHRD